MCAQSISNTLLLFYIKCSTFSRWQIKPKNLDISNAEQALESALQLVTRDLGTEAEYKIEASLYKLLLYEEGCFFARHRDNERLDGMFATLVLELPSEYEGAQLSVWSPLTPNEKMTYTFNGGSLSTVKKRRTRSQSKPSLHFAAFYADCYHEVSELMSGHRVALIYHLTATPVQHRFLRHLRAPIPVPPQPADESVALRLSRMVERFAQEDDSDYPFTWEESKYDRFSWPGAPKKLVVVLSHHYTPASLTGIKALKGSDRSIAELVRAAAFKPPNQDDLSSLARLAAKKVAEFGGEEYARASGCKHAHQLVSDEFNGNKAAGPFFDAAIALAVIIDVGTETNNPIYCEKKGSTTSWTTGPLIWLTGDESSALDLGPKKPSDVSAHYHPSWFGGKFDLGVWPRERGNHSLPIYSHELLFASDEVSIEFRKDRRSGKHVIAGFGDGDGDVKKLEFREFILSVLTQVQVASASASAYTYTYTLSVSSIICFFFSWEWKSL